MKRRRILSVCSRVRLWGLLLSLSASPGFASAEPCGDVFDAEAFVARYAGGDRLFLANVFDYDPAREDGSYLQDIEEIRFSFYTVFPMDSFPGAMVRIMIHSASREAPTEVTQHYCKEIPLTSADVIDPNQIWFSVPYMFPQVWKIHPVELQVPIPTGNDLLSIGYEILIGDLERLILFPGYDKFYAASGEAASLFTDDNGQVQAGLTDRGLLERVPGLQLGPPSCEAPEPTESEELSLNDQLRAKLQHSSCDGDTFLRIHVGPN